MEKGNKTDTNYENVNMDMSDESDNEMFACKNEYKAFKQQFSNKPKNLDPVNEYGGDDTKKDNDAGFNEYGSGPVSRVTTAIEQSDAHSSEYGGGSGRIACSGEGRGSAYSGANFSNYSGFENANATMSNALRGRENFGHGKQLPFRHGQDRPPSPTPLKIEKKAQLYKDETDNKDKKSRSKSRERNRSRERSSKSKDSERKHRSRSKGRKRSPSKGRGAKDKKRSRSRSRSRDKGRERKHDHFRQRNNERDYDSRDRRNWRKDRGEWNRDARRGGFRREEHRRNVEEQMKKVEEMGVEMPKYYKAGAINPVSYAEQVQKRKMLWKKSGAEEEAVAETKATTSVAAEPSTSFNKWEATNFGDDKANEKFRRLMGIKSASRPEEFGEVDAPGKDSERIMCDLQKNYEVARQQTHRNRGIGLGFSNQELGHPGSGYGAPQASNGVPYKLPASHLGPASVGRTTHGINFVKKQ